MEKLSEIPVEEIVRVLKEYACDCPEASCNSPLCGAQARNLLEKIAGPEWPDPKQVSLA